MATPPRRPRRPRRARQRSQARAFGDQLYAAADLIRAEAVEMMRAAAQEGLRAARENTPGEDLPKGWTAVEKNVARDPSGRFTRGFSIRIVNADKRMHRSIKLSYGGETTLSRIIEYGSRAHVIEAAPGSVLVFEIGGKTIKVKRVSHPGTPAYRPHARAIEAMERSIAAAGLKTRRG